MGRLMRRHTIRRIEASYERLHRLKDKDLAGKNIEVLDVEKKIPINGGLPSANGYMGRCSICGRLRGYLYFHYFSPPIHSMYVCDNCDYRIRRIHRKDDVFDRPWSILPGQYGSNQ